MTAGPSNEDASSPESLEVPLRRVSRLTVGVASVVTLSVAAALFLRPGASSDAVDAGVPDAHRPMVIGMPVFLARTTVVPIDEPAEPESSMRAATPESSRMSKGTRRASATRRPADEPTTGGGAASPGSTASTGSTAAGSSSGRTFVGGGGPAARAQAAAYRIDAQRVVQRQYLEDVQRCFDAATAADPSLTGEVTVGFIPGDDGRVLSSRVVRDTTGARVGACVSGAASAWRLPPPPPNALEMRMTFAL